MTFIRKEFDTFAEATAFVDRYIERYHPAGYGTSLRIDEPNAVRTTWIVRGSRGGCD